jgi:hypothetical protein
MKGEGEKKEVREQTGVGAALKSVLGFIMKQQNAPSGM